MATPERVKRSKVLGGESLFTSNYGTSNPYRLLALNVVMQALRDFRKAGDLEAWAWLACAAPDWFMGASVDFDPQAWLEWVILGCPGNAWRRHTQKGGRDLSKKKSRSNEQ